MAVCVDAGLRVVPIPGPCAVIAAIAAGGMPGGSNEFTFCTPSSAPCRKLLGTFPPPPRFHVWIPISDVEGGVANDCVSGSFLPCVRKLLFFPPYSYFPIPPTSHPTKKTRQSVPVSGCPELRPPCVPLTWQWGFCRTRQVTVWRACQWRPMREPRRRCMWRRTN